VVDRATELHEEAVDLDQPNPVDAQLAGVVFAREPMIKSSTKLRSLCFLARVL
jgi:hypothetical protein